MLRGVCEKSRIEMSDDDGLGWTAQHDKCARGSRSTEVGNSSRGE